MERRETVERGQLERAEKDQEAQTDGERMMQRHEGKCNNMLSGE